MDQILVAGRTTKARRGDLLLPAGVSERVGGAPGQNQTFWHFEGWETGVEVVEPAPSGGGFDADSPGAEPVKVLESLFQGSIDEKP